MAIFLDSKELAMYIFKFQDTLCVNFQGGVQKFWVFEAVVLAVVKIKLFSFFLELTLHMCTFFHKNFPWQCTVENSIMVSASCKVV